MTDSTIEAGTRTRTGRARALIARAFGLERVIYSSIARAIARRPAIATGAKGFHFHASSLSILAVFIVLSAVELVVVDLIVHPWPWVRIPLLIVGVWGLVWMLGLLCAHLMRPHTVGTDGIRIRDGLDLDAHVTWDDVYSVTITRRSYEPKSPRIVSDGAAVALVVHVSDATNITIVLEGPTRITLPGAAPKGGAHDVSTISLWADDPKAFLAAVGTHI